MSSQPNDPNKNTSNTAEAIRRRQDRIWEHRFVWLLLFLILGLWGYFYVIGHVDRKLAIEVTKRLRKELPGHVVSVDRAHLQPGQSITIEGIRIAKPTDQGLRDVVRIARLVCDGPIELVGLVQGQVPVQSAVADGVEICMWQLSDGRCCLQELSSNKPVSPLLPTIEIRTGMLRIGGMMGRSDQEIICHDLRLKAGLKTAHASQGNEPLMVQVDASVASSYFSSAQVHATLLGDKSGWQARGSMTKLDYSARLASQLPPQFQSYLNSIAGFSGLIDTTFEAAMLKGVTTFKAEADVTNGRLMHPKVPYPFEKISGHIYCDTNLLQLRNVRATSGDASVEFACDMHGLAIGAPLTATARVKNLGLDQRLLQAVPTNIQEIWQKLGVSGVIDADAKIAFDGTRWDPVVRVTAKNAGVNAEFFPYPITGLNGQFVYQNGTIVAEGLTAKAGDQSLNGVLRLTKAQPRWLMDLRIAADGPIPIDETLLRALTPRDQPQSGVHRFIRSLHPSGTVHVKKAQFIRSADQPDIVSRSIELTFSECAIRYDRFPYPIANIHGQTTIDNDRIILKDLSGRNDGAHIRGEGICQCNSTSVESLDLIFEAHDIGLDEELQKSLPQSVRGLWDQLQPSGIMDRVGVTIRQDRTHDLDLRVELYEDRDTESQAGQSVSLRPASVPYSVNDIDCKIFYRPGHVDINSLSGLHEASRMQVRGQCQLFYDGTWSGTVEWLPGTRFIVDQPFLSCMPQTLRDPLTKLDFRGPVSITGLTEMGSPTSPKDSVVKEWDLELQLEDGRFGESALASGIRGTIFLAGENTVDGPRAFGQLLLESLSIKNISVTGMQGPFAFNQRELLFGRDAANWRQSVNLKAPGYGLARAKEDPNVVQASYRNVLANLTSHRRQQSQPPANDPNVPNIPMRSGEIPKLDLSDTDIRARALSGTMYFSGTEPFYGSRSKYRLRLVDADFHGFLVDQGETHTQASGVLSIACDVQGSPSNIAALEGEGKVWLRNANMYELPAMIKLLHLLSVTPDKGAFDSAEIDFRIDGDRIPVPNVQLDGDLVSMHGAGWINMRRELHFDLDAHVGRRNLVGAIFRPIAYQANTRLFRIEVDGTTSNLVMKRPKSLMNSLEQVLPESSSE